MLTVLESIQLSTEFLEKKGIESPRMNAELLLADILDCKRLDLYLRFDQPLKEDEKNKYREGIARRSKFEPLQYIIGNVEFYGLKFLVDPNVLIPRQETEILIETIIEQNKDRSGLKILDIGTGSGNIPISLAKHMPDAEIISIDISEEAIKIAKGNAELNEVENVNFIPKDIFDENIISEYSGFDIIVSNPPYVGEDEFDSLQKEITMFEPKEAVTDFKNGFSFYERITNLGKELLNKNGKLYFELGIDQSERVKNIFEKEDYKNIEIKKDYLNIDRVISGEKL